MSTPVRRRFHLAVWEREFILTKKKGLQETARVTQAMHTQDYNNAAIDTVGGDARLRATLGWLLGTLLLLVIFAWPGYAMMAGVYKHNQDYSHGWLIPLVTAYLIYRRRDEIRRMLPASPSVIRAAFVTPGIVIYLLGYWQQVALAPWGLMPEFLCGVGLLLTVIGVFFALGGWSLIVALLLPLAYLVFAVPLPATLTNKVTIPLRGLVTVISADTFRLAGIDVTREGNVIHLPAATLGIVDACSGIRSLFTMLAVVGAIICLSRPSLWRAVILAAAAVFAAIVGNVFRIVSSGFLTHWIGPQYASGWRHDVCGWISFMVALGLLFSLSKLILGKTGFASPPEKEGQNQHTETAPDAVNAAEDQSAVAGVRARLREVAALLRVRSLASLSAMMLLGILLVHTVHHHYAVHYVPVPDRKPLATFPQQVGPFERVATSSFSQGIQNVLSPTDSLVATYRAPDKPMVTATILYWQPSKARNVLGAAGPHLPDTCYPTNGWERIDRASRTLSLPSTSSHSVKLRRFERDGTRQAVLYWHKGHFQDVYAARADINYKWHQRLSEQLRTWQEPLEHVGEQYVVTVVADATTSPDEAEAVVRDFMESAAPVLSEYGINRHLADHKTSPPEIAEKAESDT